MVERSPEWDPIRPEVTDANQAPIDLRGQLLALFPDRCRNGDGSDAQLGRVCSILSSIVDKHMDGKTTDQARADVAAIAETWDQTCPNGPVYTAVTLVCGIELDAYNDFVVRGTSPQV